MNTFLVIALAVTGTLASFFLGEIFILAIVVALTVFYAALFLFALTIIDANAIFANQKKLGVIPQDAKMTLWPDDLLKKWDQLT
jgi:hypothetical protein